MFLSAFKVRILVKHLPLNCPEIKQSNYLAQGGFGNVYRIRQDDKTFAIKRTFFDNPNSNNYRSKR